jgi:hypothetical protein
LPKGLYNPAGKKKGEREEKEIRSPGRCLLQILPFLSKNSKLHSSFNQDWK